MSFLIEEESTEILKDMYMDYLYESSVFPKLLEVLEKLQKCENKPIDPMYFLRIELGDKPIEMEEMLKLEQELDDATAEIRRLRLLLKKLGLNDEQEETLAV